MKEQLFFVVLGVIGCALVLFGMDAENTALVLTGFGFMLAVVVWPEGDSHGTP